MTLGSILDNIDLFQVKVPVFNMNGKNSVPSMPGGIMTLVMICTLIMYAGLKFVHMTSRHNPNISSFISEGHFDSSTKVNLVEEKFKFAFAIEGHIDKELKDSPEYVKYIMRMVTKTDGEFSELLINYHKCTTEELLSFPPPTIESEGLFKKYLSGERSMFCIDEDALRDVVVVYGI